MLCRVCGLKGWADRPSWGRSARYRQIHYALGHALGHALGRFEDRAEGNQLGLTARVLDPVVVGHDPGATVEHDREPFHLFQDRTLAALQVGQDVPNQAFFDPWKEAALGLRVESVYRERVNLLNIPLNFIKLSSY